MILNKTYFATINRGLFFLAPLFFVTNNLSAQSKTLIRVDGSSTVYPLTEAIAEDFKKENKAINIAVGVSGTGGGFKKFINGEIDIAEASRRISDSEKASLDSKKREYIELAIALDGLTVLVHKDNKSLDKISIPELKKIWEPGSTAKSWIDANPAWPKTAFKLYGPGADSGTFDYFTEAVMGKAKQSRSDYMASEDDNVIINGVGRDKSSLAYIGYSYYLANKNKVKALAVSKDATSEAVLPNEQSITDLKYPLARELYLYVSKESLMRAEVEKFVRYYLQHIPQIAISVGFVPLSAQRYAEVSKNLK